MDHKIDEILHLMQSVQYSRLLVKDYINEGGFEDLEQDEFKHIKWIKYLIKDEFITV